MAKSTKPTTTTSAAELLQALPQGVRELALSTRALILDCYPPLHESIKWNAPSYDIGGKDCITFHLRSAKGLKIIFHCGVKAKTLDTPFIEDASGLLQWRSHDRAILSISDARDLQAKRGALCEIVKEWTSRIELEAME